jgi:hypothetical protein
MTILAPVRRVTGGERMPYRAGLAEARILGERLSDTPPSDHPEDCMPLAPRLFLVAAALLLPGVALAQSASPTLPSDTLEANFAPRSAPGPSPELSPTLPSDTLDTGAPMNLPDSESGEMRRDWDQEETDGEPWRQDEEGEARMEALQFRLG